MKSRQILPEKSHNQKTNCQSLSIHLFSLLRLNYYVKLSYIIFQGQPCQSAGIELSKSAIFLVKTSSVKIKLSNFKKKNIHSKHFGLIKPKHSSK